MYLSKRDIQNIVNAVMNETQINEEFKALALSNVEQAIKIIVYRDFPEEIQQRYENSIRFWII